MGKEAKLKAERRAAREAEASRGYKIDVRPYTVQVMDIAEDGTVKARDGRPVMKEDEFDVKGSLSDILFHKELNLRPPDAFEAYELAKKIRSADKFVILDGSEMARVRSAYDCLKGISENQIEFCRRIRDAEEVSLREARDVVED